MGRSLRAAAAVWLALLLSVPVLAAGPETLVPVGRTVGLELETDGVYVAGLDETGGSPAAEAGLQVGDRIMAVDGLPLDRAEALRERVAAAGGAAVVLDVDREGRTLRVAVLPQARDGELRLGLLVRDRISGLGTLTFYDPETGLFGALGHGVGSGGERPMVIRGGRAAEAALTGVRRGEAGSPGALLGEADGAALGPVEQNTERGLFGHAAAALEGEAVPLGSLAEVSLGPAEIWCEVEDGGVRAYAVEIEAVRFDPDRCRDLRIVVTDPRLLELTGGIVRGMSGSPILQNGRLVGAVTHVLVRDPTRGYGILIGHMLEACSQAAKAA